MKDDYKEIAPHVTIVVEEIPYGQLYDNLQGAFVAGVGAPDIADVEQGVISRFLKGEPGLVPLNDLIAPYEDDYIMAKTALYAHQGTIYGIDHCLCPVVLYYQHEIFAEAGIEMPIATWDEFIEALRCADRTGHRGARPGRPQLGRLLHAPAANRGSPGLI